MRIVRRPAIQLVRTRIDERENRDGRGACERSTGGEPSPNDEDEDIRHLAGMALAWMAQVAGSSALGGPSAPARPRNIAAACMRSEAESWVMSVEGGGGAPPDLRSRDRRRISDARLARISSWSDLADKSM